MLIRSKICCRANCPELTSANSVNVICLCIALVDQSFRSALRLNKYTKTYHVPFLLLLLGFFFPRLVVVLLYLFTSWWSNAFDSILWPILGFLFMPLTVLWYGVSEAYFPGNIQTIGLVIAVLLDLGLIGKGANRKG